MDEAGGGNYQTMINEALKSYIESENSKTIRYPGGPHVELDDKFQSECEAEGLKFKGRFYDFEDNTRVLRFDQEKSGLAVWEDKTMGTKKVKYNKQSIAQASQ